jgi:5-methylcytosine-specific restriction endonuclease McrA
MVCDLEITVTTFHAGHIQSIKNGGSNNINNLEPICINCNLSMGSQNLYEYKNDYHD